MSTSSLQLRVALPSDAPALQRVFKAAIAGVPDAFYDDKQKAVWAKGLEGDGAAKLLADRQSLTWVAEGTEVVGFVQLRGQEIHMCYVDPEHGGRGVGGGLVRLAQRAALSMDRSYLLVHASRNSSPFWKSMGFKVQRVEAVSLEDVPFTRLLMRADLQSHGMHS